MKKRTLIFFLFWTYAFTTLSQTISSNKLDSFMLKNEKLNKRIILLAVDTANYQNKIKQLKLENLNLTENLSKYKHGVYFGLAFGFNYFMNGPQNFYLDKDSTLHTFGNRNGISFVVSGFMGYKISEKHSIIFNIPLSDLTSQNQFKIGLFNQRVAGGLGYGYNIGSISLIAVLNITPYQQPKFELIANHKFDDAPFTVVPIDDIPTEVQYSPSFTIGVSYNFSRDKLGTEKVGF